LEDRASFITGKKVADALIGSGIGATAGLLISDPNPVVLPTLVPAGAAIGGLVGSVHGGYKAAKHLGYGRIGRIVSMLPGGALVGLAAPKEEKENKKKNK